MNRRVIFIGLISFFGGSVAVGAEDEKSKADLARLRGAWEVVECQVNGLKWDSPLGSQMVFSDDKFIVRSKDGRKTWDYACRIDATKQPPQFDWIKKDLARAETHLGIYEIKDDTLKVCWDITAKLERPGEFVTKQDDKRRLWTLKRVQPEKKSTEKKGG